MKENVKTYFNLIITILLITASVAWMVTVASQGEIVSYDRGLIVNTLDVDIKLYQYNTQELSYDEITTPMINIDKMAPNDTRNYRIDITNNGNTLASTSIVLNDITGDIAELGPSIYFGSTSPIVKELNLEDSLEETTSGNYMIELFDSFKIKSHTTETIYWYIRMDKTAANEVADKTLTINSMNFLKP